MQYNRASEAEMKLFRHSLCTAAIIATFIPAPVLAWGKTGHRVVGALAEGYLDAKAKAGVQRILGSESVAEASDWPDFMRADPSRFWQKTTPPWHYVTVPEGKTYAEVGPPPEGDAVTALARFSATVRDPGATLADKQLALRFIIHLVGDLQQPLHVGDGTDRGGNDVKVTLFGKQTNLHAVWDSGLIDNEQLSYTEMTAWLRAKITPADIERWRSTDPLVWIAESARARARIYPASSDLSYRYVFDHKALLYEQLEKGGVRLGAYLNALFADPSPKPVLRRQR